MTPMIGTKEASKNPFSPGVSVLKFPKADLFTGHFLIPACASNSYCLQLTKVKYTCYWSHCGTAHVLFHVSRFRLPILKNYKRINPWTSLSIHKQIFHPSCWMEIWAIPQKGRCVMAVTNAFQMDPNTPQESQKFTGWFACWVKVCLDCH